MKDFEADDQFSESIINSINGKLETLTKRLDVTNDRVTRLIEGIIGAQPTPNKGASPNPLLSGSTQDRLRDLELIVERLEAIVSKVY